MQNIIALSTLIPREQSSFQRATKVSAADSRLTHGSEFQTDGPLTAKA